MGHAGIFSSLTDFFFTLYIWVLVGQLSLPVFFRGATETMDALFPFVLHVFRVAEGIQHC